MSQYPSPYQPPNVYGPGYYHDPYGQLLGPARRASVLMFILSAMYLTCGGLVFLFFALYDPLLAMLRQQPGTIINLPGRMELLIAGIPPVIFAVVLIVLGLWLRRGSRASAITSTVFCSLLLAYMLLNLLAMGGMPAAGNHPSTIASAACMVIMLVVPLIILLVWLAQAIRAASQLQLAMQQYQAQYWQYVQQQQRYAQEQQQPPAPPPPSPPSSPSDRDKETRGQGDKEKE